jgi:hypothetical protein
VSNSAQLSNASGRFLEIEVLGYQFAIAVGEVNRLGVVELGSGDANWLMVKLKASDGTQTWKSVSPALEDADMPSLVTWLRDLADDAAPAERPWWATEPNLRLVGSGSGTKRIVRVELSQEWRRPGTDLEDDPTVFEMTVGPDQLRQFAADMESISLRFPSRYELHEGLGPG